MRPIENKSEYIKHLEEYWEMSEAAKANKTNMEVTLTKQDLAESIKDFRNRRLGASLITKTVFAVGASFISSLFMGIILIWGINEVIKLNVPFTLKNILIVSLLFFIGKMKVKFTERK